jgi:hypothetical protein
MSTPVLLTIQGFRFIIKNNIFIENKGGTAEETLSSLAT